MPRDDQAFGNDLDEAKSDLVDAINELPVMVLMEVHANEAQATTPLYRCEEFRYAGAISGGTDLIKQRIREDALPLLDDYDRNVTESLATTIRTKLTEWEGGSGTLAYVFKTDYLDDLSESLGLHYEVFQLLADIMESTSAVLNEARQHVLDIMRNATAQLGGIERSGGLSAEETAAAVISGVVAGIATGGIGGVLIGSLTAAGSMIGNSETVITGGSALEILEDAGSKLDAIKSNLRESLDQIELSLDEILNVTAGPRNGDFVGPDLGEMLSNFGSHEA
ncbi:hypothetical protein [Glycomyces xiaoerkulensis]|uniref:hypothetical protein n=1 Tax=Glycomyces xiaoerkulensis TaxID=2038139 RepID=UPI0013000FD1|nr:hypothetical protein [Glycomyces xiaoerkulensis]